MSVGAHVNSTLSQLFVCLLTKQVNPGGLNQLKCHTAPEITKRYSLFLGVPGKVVPNSVDLSSCAVCGLPSCACVAIEVLLGFPSSSFLPLPKSET